VLGTIGPGCTWTDSIKIEIDEAFTLSVTKDTIICEGTSVPLEVTVNGPIGPIYSYVWMPANSLSNATIATPRATPFNTTTYSVTVEAGICIQTVSTLVTVLKPIQLIVANAFNGCINEPIQLLASGASQYSWAPAQYLNNSFIANPLATVSVPTLFTVTGFNDCFSAQKDVQVNPFMRPLENAYGDTSLCFGGIAQLNADYNSAYQYSWTPTIGLSSTTIPNPVANPSTSQEYILSINNNGCIKEDTVFVNVGEVVIAKAFLPIKYGQTPWKVKFRNLSSGAVNYVWYIEGQDAILEKEPTVTLTNEGYYSVVLKAINEFGCFDFDTLFVKVYAFFIPNLITPNGDNHNDRFEITGLGEGFSLEVYNRWGDSVYKKSNYKNEWSGEGLSDGIYYFKIIDQIMDKEYNGWVQITR